MFNISRRVHDHNFITSDSVVSIHSVCFFSVSVLYVIHNISHPLQRPTSVPIKGTVIYTGNGPRSVVLHLSSGHTVTVGNGYF